MYCYMYVSLMNLLFYYDGVDLYNGDLIDFNKQ